MQPDRCRQRLVCVQVCGDFDDRAATVACKQVGLDGPGKYVLSADHFGMGKGQIWLVKVVCNGTEPGLQWCAHNLDGMGDSCDHDEDVGIVCNGAAIP